MNFQYQFPYVCVYSINFYDFNHRKVLEFFFKYLGQALKSVSDDFDLTIGHFTCLKASIFVSA